MLLQIPCLHSFRSETFAEQFEARELWGVSDEEQSDEGFTRHSLMGLAEGESDRRERGV